MDTLEFVKLILGWAKEYTAGAAIARLEMVAHVLEGTSSYMHRDIFKAAFSRDKEE